MIATVREHREDIVRLCREHGITRLSLFGSAVKGGWRPGESDVDVLIDLEYGPGVGGRFMRFASSLERLLGVRVDITTERSVSSEEFRDELRRTAVTIYGVTREGSRATGFGQEVLQ